MKQTLREVALAVALLDAARIVEALTKDNPGRFYPAKVRQWRQLVNVKNKGGVK